MKIYISILSFLLISNLSWAEDVEVNTCPSDPVEIAQQIEAQASCYMAAKIARDCAWGSLVDIGLVASASAICLKDQDKWSDSHKTIWATLTKDCGLKYENEMGTMYRSATVHCMLNVDEVISSLNEPVQ